MTTPSIDIDLEIIMPVSVTWTHQTAERRNLAAHRIQTSEENGGKDRSSLRWYLPTGGYTVSFTNHMSQPVTVEWNHGGAGAQWITLFTVQPGGTATTTISSIDWGYFLTALEKAETQETGFATMAVMPYEQG